MRPPTVACTPWPGIASKSVASGRSRSQSEHPIGEAIVAQAQDRDLDLPDATDFDAIPGHGVQATVEGRAVAVGAERLMERLEISQIGRAHV